MNWDVEGTIRDILSHNLPNNFKINNINLQLDRTFGGYTCKVISASVNLLLTESDNKITTENLNLIMKYLPEDANNETLQLSFKKEILMYEIAIPEYIGLRKELKIDDTYLNIFPEYFGSNTKDNGSNTSISAFVMKDLQSCGYISAETMNELNLDHIKLVVDELAHFHAIGIKLKETRPEIFTVRFKELVRPALRNANNPNKNKIDCEFIDRITKILNCNVKLSRFTTKVINLIMKINDTPLPDVKEPFATLLHNDMWKNNLLFKYSNEQFNQKSKPLCVKFIDFQFVIYNSPVRDLVHLIYTSASSDIQQDFQSVSFYYYEKLINHLTLFKCKNIDQFNLETFNKEINMYAWTKFKHVLSTLLLTNDEDSYRDSYRELFHLLSCFESNGWL